MDFFLYKMFISSFQREKAHSHGPCWKQKAELGSYRISLESTMYVVYRVRNNNWREQCVTYIVICNIPCKKNTIEYCVVLINFQYKLWFLFWYMVSFSYFLHLLVGICNYNFLMFSRKSTIHLFTIIISIMMMQMQRRYSCIISKKKSSFTSC